MTVLMLCSLCADGLDAFSPPQIMTNMGVSGLTIFHVKSHLQKIRLTARDTGDPPPYKCRLHQTFLFSSFIISKIITENIIS